MDRRIWNSDARLMAGLRKSRVKLEILVVVKRRSERD